MADESTPPKAPPPPAVLVKDGRKDGPGRQLWKQIAGTGTDVPYVLRPDELRILRDACVMADRIEKLEAIANSQTMTVRGSQNQPVINPLLAEARQCALAIANMLSKIKLPEQPAESGSMSEAGTPRSVSARNAANTRWGKSG